MSENINIQVVNYNKEQFGKAINTQFTQFGVTPAVEVPASETVDIPGFFAAYDRLFLEIPKAGEINSHQYLANRSGEYAGGEDISAEIQALTAEVTQLRGENLTLQSRVIELANTTTLLSKDQIIQLSNTATLPSKEVI